MANDTRDLSALACATGAIADVQSSSGGRATVILDGVWERGSPRERDDDYRAEIVRLSPAWRVILCKDDHQWIVQRARTGRQRRTEWRGSRYFRTRKALIAACVALCGSCDPAALARLALLPEVFG
ncbi:MAG: hypothetical protein AAFU49_08070 [Pseudomonadota bacterium]